jgi:hypothetical protein
MSAKLQEGTYAYEENKYKCLKCGYSTNYPCLLLSHQNRKTPCMKPKQEEMKVIVKHGKFIIEFN